MSGLPQNNYRAVIDEIRKTAAGGDDGRIEFDRDDIKSPSSSKTGKGDISDFLNDFKGKRGKSSALKKDYVISSEFETSSDPFREVLGRFWVDDGSEIKFDRPYIPIQFNSVEPQVVDILNFENGNSYGGFAQTLTVERLSPLDDMADSAAAIDPFNQKEADFFQALDAFQEVQLIETIEVYNYDCQKPIQYPSRHGSNTKTGRPEVEISYIYNYGLENYEQYISDPSIKESNLLNYYNDYDKIRGTETSVVFSTPAFGISLFGSSLGGFSKKDNTKKERDQEFVDTTRRKENPDTNIIITEEGIKKVFDDNDALLSLPFYVKIDLNKPKHSPAGELSKEIKSTIFSNTPIGTRMNIKKSSSAPRVKAESSESDGIYDRIANYCLQLTSPSANTELFKRRDFNYSYLSANYKNSYQNEVDLKKQIGGQSVYLFDALSLANNIDEDLITINSSPQDITLIGAEELTVNTLKSGLLKNRIENLLDGEKTPKLQNSYLEIISGDADFYSTEVMFYKISKFDENDLENPIQNIFIPCKDNKQVSYIDFQVKYGKRYTYKVFVYKFVSGTNYTLSVSNAVDSSMYASYIQEYLKRRNDIKTSVNFKNLNGLTKEDKKRLLGEKTGKDYSKAPINSPSKKGKTIDVYTASNISFDNSLEKFQEDLDELITDDKRISPSKENPSTSLEARSAQLRLALRSLETLRKDSFLTGDKTPVLFQVLKEIEKEIPSTGEALTVDSARMTSESKEKLEKAKASIESFENLLNSLINELRGVLSNKNGFGKPKTTRKLSAAGLLVNIERFLDAEERMIENISSILKSDADEDFDIGSKDLTGFTYPVVSLAEIPYFEDSGAILDNPPVFPDVNFIPYKGDSKNISFFITSGIGEILQSPVILNPEESSYYQLWRESRKYNDVEPIPFITDEVKNLGASFEIYRTSSPPKNYLDFSESLYKVVSEKFKGSKNALPSVSYLEKIRPNKEYYYMFRMIDSRGVPSNPSHVFSVILVDEGGMVFPLINKYEFPIEEKKYDTPLRKVMSIYPSINQITPKAASEEGYRSIVGIDSIMGVREKQLFGKKFKIRFKSKKTGKQIDLNVTFNAKLT